MAIEFVSDEWFEASDKVLASMSNFELPEKVRDIVANLQLTDRGRDDVLACYVGGVIVKGHRDGAIAHITMPRSLAFRALILRQMMEAAKAMMLGKIRIRGNKAALLSVQTVPPSPSQQEYERRIAEITEAGA